MTAPLVPSLGAVVDALPMQLAVLDAAGTIVQVNQAWRRFGGQNGLEWAKGGPGTNYLDVCRTSSARGDPYAEQALTGLLGILAGSTCVLSFEYPCDAPERVRFFRIQAAPYRMGEQTGAVVVHLDVSAQRRAELALQQSQAQRRRETARLQSMLDLSVDAIGCIDGTGRFASVSASAERLWGRPLADLVGRPWLDLVDAPDRDKAQEALIELQFRGGSRVFRTRCLQRDGRPVHVEWTAQWFAADELTLVVARNVTDLHVFSTEHEEAIKALRQSEERFRLIARVTSDAVWEWNAGTGDLWWSQGLGRLFGEASGRWQHGFKAWQRRVHPDDVDRVMQAFQRAVDGLEQDFAIEYRFRRADATWAIVLARGFVERDEQGNALRALGGLTDLSELRGAEAAARHAAHVQACIVETQQALARPGQRFEDLMQLMCDRACQITGASGAVIELCEGPSQTVTHFATAGHRMMIGYAVALADSMSGEVLRQGRALLCEDTRGDARVDPEMVRRAGAVAMIAAPLRRGEDVIGLIKVLADRRQVFSATNVDHLQTLAESLRIILQRLRSEAELARVNRAQRLISLVNLAEARAQDELALLDEVCRLAVEEAGYSVACVLYREGSGDTPVRRVVHAGEHADKACRWLLPDDDRPHDIVLRSLRTALEQRLDVGEVEDPGCRQSAIEQGLRGVLTLPLLSETKDAFGVLALFSAEAEQWCAEERSMLRDLCGGLALGIRHIRAQRDKRRLEAAVLQVATGVSSSTPTAYFEQLCRSMAEALDAPAAFVARVVRHSGTPRARTLAGLIDGRPIETFEYDCAGTPCEQLLEAEEALIPDHLQDRYAIDGMRFPEARAYAGRSLRNSSGQVVGLLIVMWRKPLRSADFPRSVLQVFGTRAAFEIERRQSEIKLREQASLLDQAKDAIVVRGLDGRIRYWNKGAERLYGWSSPEALDKAMATLLGEDVQTTAAALARVKSQGQWSGLVHYRHRDGRSVPSEAHWTLVLGAGGRAQSILTINTDVSARLKVEEQLQQSQRLETVGQLTGGVAHDFNNLLTVILGNAELLTEMLSDAPEQLELAETVRDAAQRGAELTHQLLAFSRRQTLHPRAVDVDDLVRGLMGLLRRTLPESISVEHQAGASWTSLVDPVQLESALLNLCLNARDAMPRGGRIRIESQDRVVEPQMPGLAADLRPGPYVCLHVIDEGTGIAPSDLPRVIEPFFTTKPVGKGTGLGLSMVYGFVKQSKGHFAIDSEVDRGTRVSLYLPRAPQEPARPVRGGRSVPREGGTESILLVEDDRLVRRFAESLLAGLGYRVIAVDNGAAALEVLRGDVPVDLLFTDVVMPGGLTGPELVEAGRRLRPQLRALYSSGYTENALEDLTPVRAARLLQKPYRRAELAAAVRTALSEPPHA